MKDKDEHFWTTIAISTALSIIIVAVIGSCCGCSVVKVYDKERKAGFTALVPAYPWQDSYRVIERMNVSSRSNGFTASIRGLNDTEVTSTNAAALIESVSKGAIEGALNALKHP